MDALTDVIQLLRPKTVLLGSMVARGQWGVRLPAQQGLLFYFVTEGACWFRSGSLDAIRLSAGDYILSSKPITDAFLSEPTAATVLSDAAFKARHTVDGEIVVGTEDGASAATRILGGSILCDPANAELLIDLLPQFVHVSAAEGRSARLRTLIAIICEEAKEAGPGTDLIVSRMIEVLLVETLRREAASLPNAGMLRGLADPQLARALTDIHADVCRGWTIGELAHRSGMSRSAFARRFCDALGLAPVEYLLRWRMALAKDALRHGKGTLDQIAESIGYRSASAFSTAFTQKIGCPPSEYARMAGDAKSGLVMN